MASMLPRSARDAARAAARSAAPRRAAAASSPTNAAAAALDRLLSRPVTASPPPLGTRGLSSHAGDNSPTATVAAPPPRSPDLPTGTDLGRVEFVADDKDLASDEALWALYERWCKAYGEERSRDEMLRRFGYFKDTALRVDRANKAAIRNGSSARFAINMFADGKLSVPEVTIRGAAS